METITKTFDAQHPSGKTFEITFEHCPATSYRSFTFQGDKISFEEHQSKRCFKFSFGMRSAAKSAIETAFNTKLKPNVNVHISVTDATWETHLALLEEASKAYDAHKADKEARAAQMPTYWTIEDRFYLGDYSSSQVRVIRKMRERLPEETADQVIESFDFSDNNIGHLEAEWAADFASVKTSDDETEFRISGELAQKWVAYHALLTKEREEKAAEQKRIASEKAAAKKQAAEEARKDAEENELMLWDAGTIYSSAGNKMLHSLAGRVYDDGKRAGIYTTAYSKDIPNANTTFSIKDALKAKGFRFNAEEKEWQLEINSDADAQMFIDTLKQYDTKVWPEDLGMVRCWECGTYFRPRKGDMDGGQYYCGC